MNKPWLVILRLLTLFLAPLLLVILGMWHEDLPEENVFNHLKSQSDWWILLHLLQLLLFALAATGVFLLIYPLKTWDAWVSRVALWGFIVYYSAFDAIEGIATGILVQQAQGLQPDQQTAISQVVQLFFNHPTFGYHSWLSEFSSSLYFLGLSFAALALYRANRPIGPLLFLVLSGLIFWKGGHAYPYGSLAFFSLLIANGWLEWNKYFSRSTDNLNN